MIIDKKENKRKKWQKRIIIFCATNMVILSAFLYLLYGPQSWFRDLLITSSMTTMRHKYIAKWFYSDKVIEEVLSKNTIEEVNENTDAVLIEENDEPVTQYADKYDEAILKKDPGNRLYKVIKLSTKNYKGFLVAVYDPSRVRLVTSKYLGVKGEPLTTLAKDNDAAVAVNACGFVDLNERGNGGLPSGSIVHNGKLIYKTSRDISWGGVVGFDYHNRLVLTKERIDLALPKYDLRDAIEFGPFLIVNGKQSHVKGNGGWGIAPRTAIGQRKDGIVLLLVIDGRQPLYSIGAELGELTDIMAQYKAYNAANLDGGASSALVVKNVVQNKPTAVVKGELRALPTAWIVTD